MLEIVTNTHPFRFPGPSRTAFSTTEFRGQTATTPELFNDISIHSTRSISVKHSPLIQVFEIGNRISKLRYTGAPAIGGGGGDTNNFAHQRSIDYTIFPEQSFPLSVYYAGNCSRQKGDKVVGRSFNSKINMRPGRGRGLIAISHRV